MGEAMSNHVMKASAPSRDTDEKPASENVVVTVTSIPGAAAGVFEVRMKSENHSCSTRIRTIPLAAATKIFA